MEAAKHIINGTAAALFKLFTHHLELLGTFHLFDVMNAYICINASLTLVLRLKAKTKKQFAL